MLQPAAPHLSPSSSPHKQAAVILEGYHALSTGSALQDSGAARCPTTTKSLRFTGEKKKQLPRDMEKKGRRLKRVLLVSFVSVQQESWGDKLQASSDSALRQLRFWRTVNFQVLLNNFLLENHYFLLQALSHTLNSSLNRPILWDGSRVGQYTDFKRIWDHISCNKIFIRSVSQAPKGGEDRGPQWLRLPPEAASMWTRSSACQTSLLSSRFHLHDYCFTFPAPLQNTFLLSDSKRKQPKISFSY